MSNGRVGGAQSIGCFAFWAWGGGVIAEVLSKKTKESKLENQGVEANQENA